MTKEIEEVDYENLHNALQDAFANEALGKSFSTGTLMDSLARTVVGIITNVSSNSEVGVERLKLNFISTVSRTTARLLETQSVVSARGGDDK